MAILTVRDLAVGYAQHSVMEDLSFSVAAGDYLCIVGENGSGKSTLMKTLLGLQKPVSGQILLGDGLQKNEIGYLPQQTAIEKDFPASVREIVLSGCLSRCGLRPFYSRAEKKLAEDRRPAAAGAAGKGPLRHGKDPVSGRTHGRSGPEGHGRTV